jgi:hypothetical protein
LNIRDAVHGSIGVSETEEAVIDTPEFQRLRFVRQLATAYLIYPSAAHSRFEHSVGAMHLTGQVASRLDLEDEEVALLRLAALLHDVGHSAFSHLGDDVLTEHGLPPHEERGIELIQKGPIGDIIDEAGFSLQELESRMKGRGAGALITENLGTDRVDYLLRDAHHTGVGYSLVDRDRLLESIVLQDGRVLVHEKGFMTAESLLVSRYFMFGVVYQHPVSRITQKMLHLALDQALERKELSLDELARGTDLETLARLRDAKVELAARLLERRLFKKALVLRLHDATPGAREFLRRKDCEKKLAEHLRARGVPEGSFVVCAPPSQKSVREVEVLMKDGRVVPLEELSHLLKALEQESLRKTLVVAADAALVPKASHAAREYLESL